MPRLAPRRGARRRRRRKLVRHHFVTPRRSPSPAKTSSSGTNTSSPKRASRQTSTTKLPGATKSKLLRAYLVILAIFELPMLIGYTFFDNSLADGFSSNLADAPPERRLWAFMLALLVAARVAAAIEPSPTQLAHCAAVHMSRRPWRLESEYFLYGSGGEPFIVFMVMLNAVLFTAAARGSNMFIRAEKRGHACSVTRRTSRRRRRRGARGASCR